MNDPIKGIAIKGFDGLTLRNGRLYGAVKRTWKTRLDGEKDSEGKFVHPAIKMVRMIVMDGTELSDIIEGALKQAVVKRQVPERAHGNLEELAKANGSRVLFRDMGKTIEDEKKVFEQTVQTVKGLSQAQQDKMLEELLALKAKKEAEQAADEGEDQDEGNELGNE